MDERQRYWVGVGSNLGDRHSALRRAVDALAAAGDIEACSSIYETTPRDLLDQPAFLNLCVRMCCKLRPPEALALCKRTERELGRVRAGVRFGPRAVDCDLLLWSGGRWNTPELRIPHPRLRERRFALVPIIEIDPDSALPDGTPLAGLEAALDPVAQEVTRVAGTPRAGG